MRNAEEPPVPTVVNQVTATTIGSLVQAGVITTGDVHLHLSAPTPLPRQLPSNPRQFTGRADELAQLDAAMTAGTGTVVISALAGAGGIGKTWLALRWAHRNLDRFPDGQLFVDLRGFSPDGDAMPPAVAIRGFIDAFGADAERVPIHPHAQAALYRSLVAGKRLLVVLDNAVDTAQVVPLLPGDASCTVLVTSRNRLPGLVVGHGAAHVAVDVMPPDDARALLVSRIGPGRAHAEPAAVDDLLGSCGGYPLALSVVAGRACLEPKRTLTGLAAELREARLDGLDEEDAAASLPAVLSWSYAALTTEQARLFALLGVAPGPDIGLRAAASLAGTPVARTRWLLRGLARASLLDDGGDQYRMHDLVRHYAGDQASPSDREDALRRVIDHYLHTAAAGDHILNPLRRRISLAAPDPASCAAPLVDPAETRTWFDRNRFNLSAAQESAADLGLDRAAWQLARAVDTFHQIRGHMGDNIAVWTVGLAAATRLGDLATQARAHRSIGRSYSVFGEHRPALDHLQQALRMAYAADDTVGAANTHYLLGGAWMRLSDHDRAAGEVTAALGIYRETGAESGIANALGTLGLIHTRRGDHDQAERFCAAALPLHQAQDQKDGEADVLDCLALIAHRTGDHRTAITRYDEALALYRSLDHTVSIASTLDGIGHPHLALGHHDQAREAWTESLRTYQLLNRAADATRVELQLAALPE
ncbi:tetratricopeptide repeat protein [Actinokineospora auranticolor]|uniref:Putative ATPase n=1 Tax=Actinokineospora auranticolor TaxID=155976 RepID=A0A2S6GEU5_9PSEU|nr:tetratricopeptide repeat protein [Actinokineospora auranticolor]PPK63767.1 putative ATPase [Actinokineospora auranticolor]